MCFGLSKTTITRLRKGDYNLSKVAFNNGRLQLDNLIEGYVRECERSESNKLLPFNKYIMRQAKSQGYKETMSLRFKKAKDFVVNRNK